MNWRKRRIWLSWASLTKNLQRPWKRCVCKWTAFTVPKSVSTIRTKYYLQCYFCIEQMNDTIIALKADVEALKRNAGNAGNANNVESNEPVDSTFRFDEKIAKAFEHLFSFKNCAYFINSIRNWSYSMYMVVFIVLTTLFSTKSCTCRNEKSNGARAWIH